MPNAFLWTPSTKNGLTGTWKNLGTDGFQASEALAVNDSGAIIGSLWNRDSQTPPHAFRYHSGVMTDLNKLIPANSGITLEAATGINDAGQIIGTGLTTDGRTVSFLLTPSS